eukprot:CAMPEP_0205808616 /NCGR_PEP_ID=MMETSP0205-20121125/12613_1 /ASSEMBLY_ACC=CAM_ASM_000278 /TAXON_ID=36767 /ORGANISM="Euplotes focardii, Strain TN1" /LENGTH=315 /DNA_ID=CAMNT_0053084559 /DNA_START=161 /DNA_END=1105 /DNA_ORIENTATION=-
MDIAEMYEMEENSLEEVDEKEDDNNVVSRLEKFDREFLHKLLRKEGWEYEDGIFPFENGEVPMSAANMDFSVDEKLSAVMAKKSQNRGDLSPLENSIMHKRTIPKELTKEAVGQMSLRENMSKRFAKEDSFITPNKFGDRYSINFAKNRQNASVMQLNWLQAAISQDNNIDFSASRRKSMRIFSQRKSKFDSRSDLSHPAVIEENKSKNRIATSLSPHSQINPQNQNPIAQDLENHNLSIEGNKTQEKQERFSDRITPRDQAYIHEDDVLKEVDEADEEEKHANTPQNKRAESESNSRLKDDIQPETDKSGEKTG